MGNENPVGKSEEKFDVSLRTRNFEIDLFWKRSLFFWGFIAAAFIGYARLAGEHSFPSLVLAGFGLICSLVWTLANRGSKFWATVWEEKVCSFQKGALGEELFKDRQKLQEESHFPWWGPVRFGVSRLAIALSDYVCLLWLCLFIREFISQVNCERISNWRIDLNAFLKAAFFILTVYYGIYLAIKTKVRPKGQATEKKE